MTGAAWTPQQARSWLEGIELRGMHLGLKRVQALARRLDDPQLRFPSILISGTNGKGSVAALLESILHSAGLKVGLYTSPHLIDWPERIRVDTEPVSWEELAEALQTVSRDSDELEATPFEAFTMAAMWHLAGKGIDLGVVEVGLGGRLDATRICRALVTVVTAIGIDHVAELGLDLEGQAREKGAIMRDSVPAVLGPGTVEVREVLEEQAAECGAVAVPAEERVRVTGHRTDRWGMEGNAEWLGPAAGAAERDGEKLTFEWDMPLTGDHMVDNLITALAAVSCLREVGIPVPTGAVARGVREVRWPGRMQYVESPPGSPGLLLDVAHNPLAARAVAGEMVSRSTAGPVHMVLAQAVDKDLEGFLEPFTEVCSRVVATAWQGPRARDPAEIAECAARLADARGVRLETATAAEPAAAVAAAAGGLGEEGLVLATGSHMLVGPLLEALADGGPDALLRSRNVRANDVVPRSGGDV